MKRKMQLKPKVAPSVKLSTTLIYVAGGIVIASIIGIILFVQLNLGNSFTSLGASKTYTATKSGNWTSNGIWQGGLAPGADLDGDGITILTNNAVVRTGSISGDNGVTLTIQANATLTIKGDLIIDNNLIINNSGKLIITGSLIAKNNANVTVNGGGSMDIGNDITFNNNTNFIVNGDLTVGGDVTFSKNETFNGNGKVRIIGTGCNKWTGSSPCKSGMQILPVKLLTFKAHDDGDGSVKITWSTAIEKDNDYFTIQRSIDGITYAEIATITGNGTTQEISYYDHQDTQPNAERLYYRLTQTDYDGTTEIFAPVFVEVMLKDAQITAYPNPMTGRTLTINLPKAEAGSIQFIDHRGAIILNKKVDASSTVVELEFNRELLPGLYFVNYKSANGYLKSLKIVKK